MVQLTISTNVILFISALGVIQAALLAGLLYFHRRSDKSVTIFLSLHILTISIFMLMPAVQYFLFWQALVPLVPFQFLIGPFLYLYVRSFKERITWRKAWPHLIPAAFFLITDVNFFLSFMKKYPLTNEAPREVLLSPNSYMRVLLRNIQMVVYYILSYRILGSYQKSIQQLYSETSKINLDWVKWLLHGFFFLIVSVMILFFLVFWYPDRFALWIVIGTAIITPYIYLVTLKGISQPTLWQVRTDSTRDKVENEMVELEKSEAPQKLDQPVAIASPAANSRNPDTVARIIKLMEQEKLFTEPELTLQALASKLGIPAYQTSQCINEGLGKSFYDLVNGYRVEQAKELLTDPRNNNYTILSVGFEAGFNSKTTFNTVFKKFTGLTPTEFRQKSAGTT